MPNHSADGANIRVTNYEGNKRFNPYGLTERDKAARRSVVLRPPTLTTIIQMIDSLENIELEVKEEVKDVARRYPNQAYPHFVTNLQNIVSRVQAARRESARAYSTNTTRDDINERRQEATEKRDDPLPKAPTGPVEF